VPPAGEGQKKRSCQQNNHGSGKKKHCLFRPFLNMIKFYSNIHTRANIRLEPMVVKAIVGLITQCLPEIFAGI